jgi:hypothetical protein
MYGRFYRAPSSPQPSANLDTLSRELNPTFTINLTPLSAGRDESLNYRLKSPVLAGHEASRRSRQTPPGTH